LALPACPTSTAADWGCPDGKGRAGFCLTELIRAGVGEALGSAGDAKAFYPNQNGVVAAAPPAAWPCDRPTRGPWSRVQRPLFPRWQARVRCAGCHGLPSSAAGAAAAPPSAQAFWPRGCCDLPRDGAQIGDTGQQVQITFVAGVVAWVAALGIRSRRAG